MKFNCRTAAIFALAVVGGLQLAQREKHQRQDNRKFADSLNYQHTTDLINNPSRAAMWAPSSIEEPEKYINHLIANRQICLTELRAHLGLLPRKGLRLQTNWLMEKKIVRDYFQDLGGARETEARSRKRRRFYRALQESFMARPEVRSIDI